MVGYGCYLGLKASYCFKVLMHKNVHVGREAFISNAFLAVKRAGHGPVMKSVVATKVGFTSQRAVDDS